MSIEVNDKGKVRVFVYGSLKQGHGNHPFLSKNGALFMGYDTITGPFAMYSLGYFPGVVRLSAADALPRKIYGEVWCGDVAMLEDLDALEGNGSVYTREKLWTDRLDKRVWCYFLPENPYAAQAEREVTSGMWEPLVREQNFWKAQEGAISA